MLLLGLHTGFSGDRYGGWYPYLFKNFPQFVVIHVVKGFHVVDEAVDVFVGLPCFLHDPMNVGNLISGSSASLKLSLYIGKFLVHILLKPLLMDFEHNLARMSNKHNCTGNMILNKTTHAPCPCGGWFCFGGEIRSKDICWENWHEVKRKWSAKKRILPLTGSGAS